MEDSNGVNGSDPLHAGEDAELEHEAKKVRPSVDAHSFLSHDSYILCCKQLLPWRIRELGYEVLNSMTKLSSISSNSCISVGILLTEHSILSFAIKISGFLCAAQMWILVRAISIVVKHHGGSGRRIARITRFSNQSTTHCFASLIWQLCFFLGDGVLISSLVVEVFEFFGALRLA